MTVVPFRLETDFMRSVTLRHLKYEKTEEEQVSDSDEDNSNSIAFHVLQHRKLREKYVASVRDAASSRTASGLDVAGTSNSSAKSPPSQRASRRNSMERIPVKNLPPAPRSRAAAA